ncbi:SDR family oxidoreductase [Sulfurimonas sp. HSL3-2]|uniref:SDR family NAD(P)-dependent oxidoreductase n=1 Tax=Hydrocurvibacter mobilis TaxID=3131936 RepID=UPI0031F7EC1F
MKTVLITGANSGIGFTTVKLFLENGYKVFAHYNTSKNNLEKIKTDKLILLKSNFKNIEEVENLFEMVTKQTPTIDILVNNAGLYAPADNFSGLGIKLFDDVLNVNLKAPFLLSKKFIELMKNYKRGKIINISSIGVKYGGSIKSMQYTIAKSALETMTLGFAKEGAKYNILVNALRVGVTDTSIHSKVKDKNMKERIEMIPLKRMAKPEEISEYILFLSSEKSNFTTGSIITISGGE